MTSRLQAMLSPASYRPIQTGSSSNYNNKTQLVSRPQKTSHTFNACAETKLVCNKVNPMLQIKPISTTSNKNEMLLIPCGSNLEMPSRAKTKCTLKTLLPMLVYGCTCHHLQLRQLSVELMYSHSNTFCYTASSWHLPSDLCFQNLLHLQQKLPPIGCSCCHAFRT